MTTPGHIVNGPMAAAVVDIEALRCEVAGRTTLAVPRLTLHAGERVALVGPNGAGKSTLLRTLSGFAVPAAGRVAVLGCRLGAGLPRGALRQLRSDVGQVMQGLHLVQRLSVLDNVLIGALARRPGWRSWVRWHTSDVVGEATQALAAVGLAHRADERADRLSGGERQKVAIARMLMQRPRLILADEPTASLDPAAAHEVCDLLVRAATAVPGATLVTVVHAPALLPRLADRVVGLRHGQVAFDLPLAAVDEPTLAALYHPMPESAAVTSVSATLAGRSATVATPCTT